MSKVPLVLVAGLSAAHAAEVADTLVSRGTAVVHHDLTRVGEGVVRRRIRHEGEDRWEILELAHGCVSCTLREDVLPLVIQLAAAPGVARIVLHLDPTLEPEAVCWALRHILVDSATALDSARIAATVTVVDATTWFDDATGDQTLAERVRAASADDERTVAQVVVGQAEFADAIVVAGAAPDVVTARRTDAVLDRLAPLAPRARAGSLDIDVLLAVVPAAARRGALDSVHAPLLRGQPPMHPVDGVSIALFTARRPFHPERLHNALQVLLDGVVRARGRVWVATQPDEVLYLESAGECLDIGHGGKWLAAADDWRDIDPERRAMAALRWDERYGDREQSLVAISYDADPGDIEDALCAALLTDVELDHDPARWPDPFGTWHADPCTPAESAAIRDDERGQA